MCVCETTLLRLCQVCCLSTAFCVYNKQVFAFLFPTVLPNFLTKMVVMNPNNWHWVDKNTLPWTNDYLGRRFTNWQHSDDEYVFTVEKLNSCEGDSNVSQRKGKVICYFDLHLKFDAVLTKDGEEISRGVITVPEFMHDEDDFEVRFDSFGEHSALVKKLVLEKLVSDLLAYQPDLIDSHSRDLQQ